MATRNTFLLLAATFMPRTVKRERHCCVRLATVITQTLRNSTLYVHCSYFLGTWYYKARSPLLLYWLWSFTNKPQERIVRAVWKVGRKLWKRVCFESLMWDRCQNLMMFWRLKQEWLQWIILNLCKSHWSVVLELLCVKASREKLCLCVCDLSSASLCCRRPYYSFIIHLSLLNLHLADVGCRCCKERNIFFFCAW